MNGNELSVYLFRSYLKICLNLDSREVSVQECDANQVSELYQALKGIRTIRAGENVLKAVIEDGKYSLCLNEKQVLQTTTTTLIVHYLSPWFPITLMIVFVLAFLIQEKNMATLRKRAMEKEGIRSSVNAE